MRPPFNTGEPLGYFLTWTTYGTWLPGDQRGWTHKDAFEKQPPSRLRVENARRSMAEPEYLLSLDDRATVEATIETHCQIRRWTLHAVNARTNHVHVVVAAPSYDPETVRDQFKAWGTRKLKERYRGRKRFWTEGGSGRWLNTEDALESAVIYVRECQD